MILFIIMYQFNLQRKSLSGFDLAKFVPFDDSAGGYDVVDPEMVDKLQRLPRFGEIQVSGEAGRLDLLSHQIYGTTGYWWVLLIYNSLGSWEDVVAGITIAYPSLSALEKFYFQLRSLAAA